jgi:hypothetical protein
MDNLDMFYKHEHEQRKLMKRLPICYECDDYIQSEYVYNLCGHDYCEDCMEEINIDDEYDFDRRKNEV